MKEYKTLSPKVDHSHIRRDVLAVWRMGAITVRVFYLRGESCVILCTALYNKHQAKQRMLNNFCLLIL